MTKPISYPKYILGAILSAAVLFVVARKKDSTAQGLAKIRHCESMLNPSERLYVDPYAHRMFPGSWVQTAMGGNITRAANDWLLVDGMFDLLTLRTKWIDDAILAKAAEEEEEHKAEQLVILGAGYDTRGFRLDLPDGFVVWEFDQPGVQTEKRNILEGLATTDRTVAERLGRSESRAPTVKFLGIDFNKDSIGERILSQPTFDRTKPTIVTLEGVSQYIPESSTATTLKQVRSFLAEGSVLLISYVPSEILEDQESACPGRSFRLKWMFRLLRWIGEPWISTWNTMEDFAFFLREHGYEVVEDVDFAVLNQRYLEPLNRGRKDDELCNLERYVVARVV